MHLAGVQSASVTQSTAAAAVAAASQSLVRASIRDAVRRAAIILLNERIEKRKALSLGEHTGVLVYTCKC